MEVDVLIPVYRPDGKLTELLKRLKMQNYPIHRVILMNTEEKHFPAELTGIWDRVEVYHLAKEEFDHGGTRDRGVRMSTADLVLCMTQDAMPADRELLAELLKALEQDENIAAAYARQLPNENCRIVERYTRSFNYPDESRKKGKADIEEMGIKTFFCSDVCAAYRVDLFHKLGGFESPVIFNEDMFFAAKAVFAGYYVKYEAEAKVIHSHNYTVRQQFHRNFDLAVSQTMHPEIFEQISSEAEGMKLVKSTMKYLCSIGKPYLIFELGIQCVGKYAGYRLGKRYKKLSRKQILKCTMSPEYWKRLWNQEVSDGNR